MKQNIFKNYYNVFKWIWLVLVTAFVIIYVCNNFNNVINIFTSLPLSNIYFSFLVLIIGKISLSLSMLFSLKYTGITISFWDCYGIYNITQLSKYIPGSIWQFVSRIGIYSKYGMNAQEIRTSMTFEMLWLLSSAFIIGGSTVFLAEHNLILSIFKMHTKYLYVIPITVFFATIALIIKNKQIIFWVLNFIQNWKLNTTMVLIQGCVWISLGLSFSLIVLPFLSDTSPTIYLIGLYALAYIIGFSVPFAPAGIGIREGILVLGVSIYLPQDISIIVSGMSRMMYLTVEIFLVTIAFIPMRRIMVKNHSYRDGR